MQSTLSVAATGAGSALGWAAPGGTLPTRPIPGTNEALPIVGFGNAMAFQEGNVALSRELLGILLDHGGSYVDTSEDSRFTVGRLVHEMHAEDRTFIASYIVQPDEAAARQDIASVIAAQGGGPLDLVLTRDVEGYGARVDEFKRIKGDGLTRYIGVARHRKEYHEAMMQLIRRDAIDFLQVNYSLLEPDAEERLLPLARDKGVAVVTNRPFINGEWFALVRGRPLPAWASEFDCSSWAQFSLKFILANPAVNCVLTETSNPLHALDNMAGGLGRLPDDRHRERMRRLVQSFL